MEWRLQMSRLVKRIVVILAVFAFVSCGRSTPARRAAAQPSSIQTVDSVPPNPSVIQPPATITDLGPTMHSGSDLVQAPTSTTTVAPPTPQDEALRASLPFAPAIAMDPVDGSKISIRANTPTAEYKGHVFYFSSEANKRAFIASPDQYLKGVFAHL